MVKRSPTALSLSGTFLLVLISTGCSPQPGVNKLGKHQSSNQTQSVTSGQSPPQGNSRMTAPEFIATFIKALNEGTPADDMLAPAFKQIVAKPRFGSEEDSKLGYNKIALESSLSRFRSAHFTEGYILPSNSGTTINYWGTIAAAGGKNLRFLIMAVPADRPGGWLISWFHVTSAMGAHYRDLTAENLAPALVCRQFLDNLIGGDLASAEAVMNIDWKQSLAFSTTDSNKEQGYDSRLLQDLKLKSWAANALDYSISNSKPGEKCLYYFGILIGKNGKDLKTFTLKVVHESSGNWTVEQFEVKS